MARGPGAFKKLLILVKSNDWRVVQGNILYKMTPLYKYTRNVASPTKKPIVVVAVDATKIQTTKNTCSSRSSLANGAMRSLEGGRLAF